MEEKNNYSFNIDSAIFHENSQQNKDFNSTKIYDNNETNKYSSK